MDAFSSKKSFTLESFYQLLHGRIFYGNVDYAQWLMHCIENASIPIPTIFALAIKEFVSSVFLVDRIQKIPEHVLLPYFENTSEITTPQVLLTLYILAFHENIISFKTDQKLALTNHQEQQEYSAEFVDRLPIRLILNHIQNFKDGIAYKGIYRDFIASAANLYPELFDVTSLLLQEGKQDSIISHRRWFPSQLSLDTVKSILSNHRENSSKVISVLSYVENMESVQVSPYAELCISHLLKLCLDKDMDQDIAEALVSTWESLNLVIPHELWIMTANALRDETVEMKYSFDAIIHDPLSLFKCDKRVFRSEKILPVWLHYLGCVRICSKHRIWKRFHTKRNTQVNTRNVMALINAQDTSMIQLLLESCIPTEADKEFPETLKVVQRLICQFVHGLFIDSDRDMLLAKILHFQTYSIELLPVVVEFIPSLFAVFNFIPELVRQPQPEKQVFAILLACHLCEKYPLENYLRTAEHHVLPRLLKIAFPSVPASSVCIPSEYLVQAIPGFVHLAKAYPHFGLKILQVFDEIARGLPQPQEFVGQEGNSKIILVLRLHQVLNFSRECVQYEVDHNIKQDNE